MLVLALLLVSVALVADGVDAAYYYPDAGWWCEWLIFIC